MKKSTLLLLILVTLNSYASAEETLSYWDRIKNNVSLEKIKSTLNDGVDTVISTSKDGLKNLDNNVSQLDINITRLTAQSKEKLKSLEVNLSKLDNQVFDVAQKIDIDKQESSLINKIQSTFPNYDTSTATLSIGAGSDLIRAVTISDKQMNLMAKSAIVNSDKNHTLAPDDSNYSKRLIKLNSKLVTLDHSKLDIKAYIDNNISAFATQNNSVRINSAVMDILSNEQLLFVIGHELGHVKHKHSKNNYRITYALSGLGKGAKANGGLTGYLAKNGVALLSDYLVKEQFSEDEELEADAYALKFLKANGQDASVAIDALKKLKANFSAMLLVHPLYASRMEMLK